APESCGYVDVMSQEMRQAIVDVHNNLRYKLAEGKVQRSSISLETLPKAANMRAMKYDCTLEKVALDVGVFGDDCKVIPPRTAFTDTGRNYHFINTTMRLHRAVMSPKEALVKMAMADTEELGCAVNFCSSGSRNYYAVYCYYGRP
ncbi:SCP-like protein, partial [Ostertagia ostertagi]